MNKYIVTRPLEHPRDTITYSSEPPPQEMFEVEADFYSVSGEGTAHFYRNPDPKRKNCLDYKPELVTSVSPPFVVRKKEEGTGGRGMVAWGGVPWRPWESPQWRFDLGNDPASFLAAVISEQRLATARLEKLDRLIKDIENREQKLSDSPPSTETPKPPVTHALPLTWDELHTLRLGLKKLDPGNATAADAKLDAKLYSSQVILKSMPAVKQMQEYGEDWYKQGGFPPGTFKAKADVIPVTIRYRGRDLRVYQQQVNVPRNADAHIIDVADEPKA
jgi:hypothetical protein